MRSGRRPDRASRAWCSSEIFSAMRLLLSLTLNRLLLLGIVSRMCRCSVLLIIPPAPRSPCASCHSGDHVVHRSALLTWPLPPAAGAARRCGVPLPLAARILADVLRPSGARLEELRRHLREHRVGQHILVASIAARQAPVPPRAVRPIPASAGRPDGR